MNMTNKILFFHSRGIAHIPAQYEKFLMLVFGSSID